MAAKKNIYENLAAEQMVIGKVLQGDSAYWAIADVLQPFHFAREIHQRIFQTLKDIYTEGKRLSIALLESRLGPEYDDDGKSTSALLTALLRDAENQEDALDQVEVIVGLWRQRRLIQFYKDGLKAIEKPDVMSADHLASAQIALDDIGESSSSEPLKALGDIAERAVKRSKTAQKTGVSLGFDTGLPSLDALIGKIHPGDLGVIGAAPGDGKTVLGAQIAMRAQLYGPTLYFQLEMKDEDMARRYLADKVRMSVADIEEGNYDFEAAMHLDTALEQLRKTNVFIDDRAKLNINQIADRCLQAKRRYGRLVSFVVDHARLVRVPGKVRDRFERHEIVTGSLKAIAKDMDAACILLSQVTRESQRRAEPVPQLTDFDGGSSIEQDADWAVALFRRDRWLKGREPATDPDGGDTKDRVAWAKQLSACRGRIEAHVRKGRRRGDGEHRDFEFDGRHSVFREIKP